MDNTSIFDTPPLNNNDAMVGWYILRKLLFQRSDEELQELVAKAKKGKCDEQKEEMG